MASLGGAVGSRWAPAGGAAARRSTGGVLHRLAPDGPAPCPISLHCCCAGGMRAHQPHVACMLGLGAKGSHTSSHRSYIIPPPVHCLSPGAPAGQPTPARAELGLALTATPTCPSFPARPLSSPSCPAPARPQTCAGRGGSLGHAAARQKIRGSAAGGRPPPAGASAAAPGAAVARLGPGAWACRAMQG